MHAYSVFYSDNDGALFRMDTITMIEATVFFIVGVILGYVLAVLRESGAEG